VRALPVFALLLTACPQSPGPSFGGGGSSYEEPEDTGYYGMRDIDSPDDILDIPMLADCIERAEVPVYEGDAPADIQGQYQVSGEVVVSDEGWTGATVSSTMCLFDQSDEGTISVSERTAYIFYTSDQAWVRGEGDEISILMETLGEDAHHGGCIVQNVGLLSATVDDDGTLEMRTAVVSVGMEGCDPSWEAYLGGCHATVDSATLSGTCEG